MLLYLVYYIYILQELKLANGSVKFIKWGLSLDNQKKCTYTEYRKWVLKNESMFVLYYKKQ